MTAAFDQRDTLSYTWRIQAGERETLNIPVLDEADDPASVDGWTVDAVIKDRPGGILLHAFAGANAVIESGTVRLVVPAATSRAWVWRNGWWRLVVINPANPDDPAAYRLVQGPVVVDPD